jgi:hypothetical protein
VIFEFGGVRVLETCFLRFEKIYKEVVFPSFFFYNFSSLFLAFWHFCSPVFAFWQNRKFFALKFAKTR